MIKTRKQLDGLRTWDWFTLSPSSEDLWHVMGLGTSSEFFVTIVNVSHPSIRIVIAKATFVYVVS